MGVDAPILFICALIFDIIKPYNHINIEVKTCLKTDVINMEKKR